MIRSTLVKSPPVDPSKAPIENVLELTPLVALGPVSLPPLLNDLLLLMLYNRISSPIPGQHSPVPRSCASQTEPGSELWHPPGARGIFGGAVIAQSLAAAQKTIPLPSPSNNNATFLIHSMHCYFVLAGDSTIPILYHVERVREGKSFMTRTVQARQRGKCIFTTTCSFMREGSGGEKVVEHEWSMPEGAVEALQEKLKEGETHREGNETGPGMESELLGSFITKKLGIINRASQPVLPMKTRMDLSKHRY